MNLACLMHMSQLSTLLWLYWSDYNHIHIRIMNFLFIFLPVKRNTDCWMAFNYIFLGVISDSTFKSSKPHYPFHSSAFKDSNTNTYIFEWSGAFRLGSFNLLAIWYVNDIFLFFFRVMITPYIYKKRACSLIFTEKLTVYSPWYVFTQSINQDWIII